MKLKFLPQNVSVDTVSSKSVMDVAREQQLPINSSCNGMCVCAECRVYIVEGENHVLPPTEKEVELIGGGYFVDRRRLACQLFCFGNVTVDLSEQVERVNKKRGITKQFLKKLSKDSLEEVASVGGVLVEKDQEIRKTDVSEEMHPSSESEDTFYKKPNRSSMRESRKNFRNSYNTRRRHRKRFKKNPSR